MMINCLCAAKSRNISIPYISSCLSHEPKMCFMCDYILFLSFLTGMAISRNGFTILFLVLITFFILDTNKQNEIPSAGPLVGQLYLQESWDMYTTRGSNE